MPIRPPLGDQHLPELSRHAEPSPREQPLLPPASRSSASEHFCLARRAGVSASARRTTALDERQASRPPLVLPRECERPDEPAAHRRKLAGRRTQGSRDGMQNLPSTYAVLPNPCLPAPRGATALGSSRTGASAGSRADSSATKAGEPCPQWWRCCLTPQGVTPARLPLRAERGCPIETAGWATKRQPA
jgi:hypothetical protein